MAEAILAIHGFHAVLLTQHHRAGGEFWRDIINRVTEQGSVLIRG
jgi:phage replication-related protein YjqB (UPF0714/DUF867 family)